LVSPLVWLPASLRTTCAELNDAIIHLIDNPEATVDDLMKFVKGPDFPTGGIVYGKESLRTAYSTGRGGVVVRAVAEIKENDKGRHRIVITEIPYGLNKASLIEKIADLVHDKKIIGISDLRDESSGGEVLSQLISRKDAYPKKISEPAIQTYSSAEFVPLQYVGFD
jgi:DNA gyrase subunit A